MTTRLAFGCIWGTSSKLFILKLRRTFFWSLYVYGSETDLTVAFAQNAIRFEMQIGKLKFAHSEVIGSFFRKIEGYTSKKNLVYDCSEMPANSLRLQKQLDITLGSVWIFQK
jgi:hypothetical protein